MVLETPGLSQSRRENLTQRKPHLRQLCKQMRAIAEKNKSKNVSLIELNSLLAGKPELIARGDGVHPTADGYKAIARSVADKILEGR